MECEDLSGQKFGKLTAISRVYLTNRYRTKWLCICECGTEKTIYAQYLKSGHTKSCGCLVVKHGLYYEKAYKIWTGIKSRCVNKKDAHYPNYGARGIAIFDEWLNNPVSFIEYVSQLENYGKDKYSLDRINNDGNYEPGNLRWATCSEQSHNTRVNKLDWDKVNKIRELFKSGKNKAELSRMFGVTRAWIRKIVNNKSWKIESENYDSRKR